MTETKSYWAQADEDSRALGGHVELAEGEWGNPAYAKADEIATGRTVKLGPTGAARYEVLGTVGKGIVVVRNLATEAVQSVNRNRVRIVR